MSSFEPSRIPAWLAPVCEERSVSHSASRCVPSSTQRAIVGALPSRIARCSTGRARPSISRKTIPGASVTVRLARAPGDPLDHAERVGVVVVRAEDDVEHDRHRRRRRRRPRAPTRTSRSERSPSVMRSAASSISASATRISSEPGERACSGSRSAASKGGTIAFRTAIASAATSAPQEVVDCCAGHDPGGDEQGRGGDEPRHQEVQRPELRAARAASSERPGPVRGC